MAEAAAVLLRAEPRHNRPDSFLKHKPPMGRVVSAQCPNRPSPKSVAKLRSPKSVPNMPTRQGNPRLEGSSTYFTDQAPEPREGLVQGHRVPETQPGRGLTSLGLRSRLFLRDSNSLALGGQGKLWGRGSSLAPGCRMLEEGLCRGAQRSCFRAQTFPEESVNGRASDNNHIS